MNTKIIWRLVCFCAFGLACLLYLLDKSTNTAITNSSKIRNLFSMFKRSPVDTMKTFNGCLVVSLPDLETAPTTPKNKIPLLLHQIYIHENSADVAEQYIPLLTGCRNINPDFIHLLWTKETIHKLLTKRFPQYLSIYQKYNMNVEKADFIRVVLLYHFGGVYMDMDVECLKPFSKNLDKFNTSAVVDQERPMQTQLLWNRKLIALNSLMITRKGHPFFKFLLEKFPEHMKFGKLFERTGPVFLQTNLMKYDSSKRPKGDRVQMANPLMFSPLLDPYVFNQFNEICTGPYEKMNEVRRIGCKEWNRLGRKEDDVKKLTKDSITVHKFLHLVYPPHFRFIKKKVDVCTGVKKLSIFS